MTYLGPRPHYNPFNDWVKKLNIAQQYVLDKPKPLGIGLERAKTGFSHPFLSGSNPD